MQLTSYIDTVRRGVRDAASLADEHTRSVAERLAQSLDSATRLALIRALSDAAAEISTELAPGSVEVRLLNDEPQFVVSLPADSEQTTVITAPDSADENSEETGEDDGDAPMSRVSLRLPLSVKERVDEAADRDGVSTNTWLTRAVQAALTERRRPAGWAQPAFGQIFGPDGPFGPQGVFGQHGVFGQTGDPGRSASSDRPGRSRRHHSGPGGRVQGWVR